MKLSRCTDCVDDFFRVQCKNLPFTTVSQSIRFVDDVIGSPGKMQESPSKLVRSLLSLVVGPAVIFSRTDRSGTVAFFSISFRDTPRSDSS